jgi:transglutaminase-like putative cysteine protease
VLLVIALYGYVGPSPALAGALGAAVLVGLLLPSRMALGLVAQLLLGGFLFVVGIAIITSAFVPPEPVIMGTLRLPWSASAFATLLVAVGRLYVVRPSGGHPVTLAVALFGLAFCGGTISGLLYPVVLAAFLAAAAFARRLTDPGRAPLGQRIGRSVSVLILASVAAAGASYASTVLFPRAHGWMVRRIMQSAQARTGFTNWMWLGSMGGMLMSERVVLRLRGKRADYLRGTTFTRYDIGRWYSPGRDMYPTTDLPRAIAGNAALPTTEVEIVDDDPDRYFVPLGVRGVAVSTGTAGVHPTGVLRPLAAAEADQYSFEHGGPRALPVAEPDWHDLRVPPNLQRSIGAVAERFTRSVAGDPVAELAAIERALTTEYRYALEFERSDRADPIVDFLERGRTGHCEYFASAMVLLARSRGIPARLVSGYRVTEYSELGDYYIVRDRNAHAWVEAWLPNQGWTTFDPTPSADLALAMRTKTPWAAAVADLVRSWWAVVLRWLDQRTILELAGVLFALIAVGVVLRLARHLRERSSAHAGGRGDPPPELFDRLCDALAAHGLVRAEHETVELLAERVRESGLPPKLRTGVSAALSRYAALRYGGIGDEAELASEAARLVGALGRATPVS